MVANCPSERPAQKESSPSSSVSGRLLATSPILGTQEALSGSFSHGFASSAESGTATPIGPARPVEELLRAKRASMRLLPSWMTGARPSPSRSLCALAAARKLTSSWKSSRLGGRGFGASSGHRTASDSALPAPSDRPAPATEMESVSGDENSCLAASSAAFQSEMAMGGDSRSRVSCRMSTGGSTTPVASWMASAAASFSPTPRLRMLLKCLWTFCLN
mmetsp:Transcript_40579/g.96408  ORF Transcript_40579/g.96408 Transcript_40579/m.96408 type:complete len:219 (+) Transcript_40579:1494-2150(+)